MRSPVGSNSQRSVASGQKSWFSKLSTYTPAQRFEDVNLKHRSVWLSNSVKPLICSLPKQLSVNPGYSARSSAISSSENAGGVRSHPATTPNNPMTASVCRLDFICNLCASTLDCAITAELPPLELRNRSFPPSLRRRPRPVAPPIAVTR